MHFLSQPKFQEALKRYVPDSIVAWVVEQACDWSTYPPVRRRNVIECLEGLDLAGRHALYFHGSAADVEEFEPFTKRLASLAREPLSDVRAMFREHGVARYVTQELLRQAPQRGGAATFPGGENIFETAGSIFETVLEDMFRRSTGKPTVFRNPFDALVSIRNWMPIGCTDGAVLLVC